MADYSIKQDDTYPALQVTLLVDGTAIDVSSATVTFNARNAKTGAVIVSGGTVADVTDGTDGKVKFTFVASQTATPGTYQGEFVVDFGSGTVGTFPAGGYIPFTITDDIA